MKLVLFLGCTQVEASEVLYEVVHVLLSICLKVKSIQLVGM